MRLPNRLQELRELGLGGTLFRARWEVSTRFVEPFVPIRDDVAARREVAARSDWRAKLPFADPSAVAEAMRDRIDARSLEQLRRNAEDATRGRLLCYGRWTADYGDPIDWHLNPTTGQRWTPERPWSTALAQDSSAIGDVKHSWEPARFAQAYRISRAAAFFPDAKEAFACALRGQLDSFVAANPIGRGIHWASGQEIALRMMAWLFATDVLLSRTDEAKAAAAVVGADVLAAARHIERAFDYARHAVYNNHLLAEALGLYIAGLLMPDAKEAARWRRVGSETLEEQAVKQFYPDGGYIQLSHTYHRAALQLLLWASVMARAAGDPPSGRWHAAIERSLDFLLQNQSETAGTLPNFGPNDGGHPSVLSTCDVSDFRPELQAASVLTRGERIFPPGPWDEASAWLFGPSSLDLPLRQPRRVSSSFAHTGFHVLRAADARNFATLRCGSVLDRFGQIDMLHVDVWWHDLNIAVDGGSYLYNGPRKWHDHFTRTGSHNTVMVDGVDQMLHVRKFKTLYPTRAQLLKFSGATNGGHVVGEHYGFDGLAGGCVHRRSVLLEGDIVVVVDRLAGVGEHSVRLQWLLGDFPFQQEESRAKVRLDTPDGAYTVGVYRSDGHLEDATVVAGGDEPPRGWLSRYYGEKVAVPSLAVERRTQLPAVWFSVFAPSDCTVVREGSAFVATTGTSCVRFDVQGELTA